MLKKNILSGEQNTRMIIFEGFVFKWVFIMFVFICSFDFFCDCLFLIIPGMTFDFII